MKDQFSKQLKEKMDRPTLSKNFDQNFYKKFNKVKDNNVHDIPAKKSRPFFQILREKVLTVIAPVGLASALASLIIMVTSIEGPFNSDYKKVSYWEDQTQMIHKIQSQEINELGTLPEGMWENLLSSAH